MKEVYAIRDVKFLGITNSLEFQYTKFVVDDNNELLDKANIRGSICLDKPESLDAEKALKKNLEGLIDDIVIEQAKIIGELNAQINGLSGEVKGHKKDKKELNDQIVNLSQDKMILQTEKETLKAEKETLKAEKETLKAEKETLKAEKETLVSKKK